MAESTLAGVITAIATVLTALALLVTAFAGIIPQLLKLRRSVGEVHTIVNQQRTDAMRYQRALITALEAKGIDVPVDQSIDPKE